MIARKLTSADIFRAAESLGLDFCMIKAVIDVESAGSGFSPDGRVKILFEGHIFWRQLKSRGIDPSTLAEPDVLYPRWDRSKYRRGTGEWDRLESAMCIHPEAALCSASWGLFQIMGFNYVACGFDSVQDFVAAQKENEAMQLESFCEFLRVHEYVPFLAACDWAAFARHYNGPGYAANNYDAKLARGYGQCRAAEGIA